jgi:major membrane immunogen (membrane-anchored lipoprotein)
VAVLFLFPTSTNRTGAGLRLSPVVLPVARGGTSGTGGSGTSGGGTNGSSGTTGGGTSTVDGAAADTQYGPVQVELQISGGKIVAATAIQFPQSGGRDREINSYAIPVLQQETVAAQSAQIDTVSGATYTSQGYLQSLQSALDSAHLG